MPAETGVGYVRDPPVYLHPGDKVGTFWTWGALKCCVVIVAIKLTCEEFVVCQGQGSTLVMMLL